MKVAGEIISPSIDFEKGICSVCRKRVVNRWCDFIISYNNGPIFFRNYKDFVEINRRGAQYETCDLPMCEECVNTVSHDTHICPHHNKLLMDVDLPDEYQKQRQQREKSKILREVLDTN